MKFLKALALAFACMLFAATATTPARASIDSQSLGATYNAGKTQITFRVYSSQATRVVLYLYTTGYGVQESATYVLTNVGSNVWQTIVSVSAIKNAGITGTVYYGYRAWGPNWPYSASWTKGSSTGFISDVDSNGNRFNPNKLLIDPYALEISQDPLNANNQNGNIFASGASYRDTDSGTYAPKGIVLSQAAVSTGTKPTRAQKDDLRSQRPRPHRAGPQHRLAVSRHLLRRRPQGQLPRLAGRHCRRVPPPPGDPERRKQRHPQLRRRPELLGL
jgi:glycogen operon protein